MHLSRKLLHQRQHLLLNGAFGRRAELLLQGSELLQHLDLPLHLLKVPDIAISTTGGG
jgi:hypothetical protein